MFASSEFSPKIKNIFVFFDLLHDDGLGNDNNTSLQMPANQNLCSALAMSCGNLLEAGVLKDLRSPVDQGGVGRDLYSSFAAELPQFGLTEEGVTLHLIDGRHDGASLDDVFDLHGVEV